jgi:hypothetical protein
MARSPFKRLIAQIPLLLQAIALIALAFALSRPATRGREFTGDHVAIVIDASASMSALAPSDGKEPKTRLDLAKQAAKDMLSSLTPGSDALILQAGREAHLLSPLDRDIVRVKAAVDRVHVEDVEGDLGAAVALAVDRLRQMGGSRRIVVLTDGNLARPHSLAGAALPVEVITVGVPVDNTAIVRVDVRSGTDTALNRSRCRPSSSSPTSARRPARGLRHHARAERLRRARLAPPARAARRAQPRRAHLPPFARRLSQGPALRDLPARRDARRRRGLWPRPRGRQAPRAFRRGSSPWIERASSPIR